jgi:hypothetical protein
MKVRRFLFYLFFYFFVWFKKLSLPQTRPWHPRHGSIISGGHGTALLYDPSHGIQYEHTNWYGGHNTVILSTCHVSGIFSALTEAYLWRVARGWITRSGDSVLGRGDKVQTAPGVQLVSYSIGAGVLSRR